MLLHFLLAGRVSFERLAVIQIGFLLNIFWSFFHVWFNIFLCVQLRRAWQWCFWMRVFLDWICLGFFALPVFGFPLCSLCLESSPFLISLNTSYNPNSLLTPSGIPIILILEFLMVSFIYWIDLLDIFLGIVSDFLPNV